MNNDLPVSESKSEKNDDGIIPTTDVSLVTAQTPSEEESFTQKHNYPTVRGIAKRKTAFPTRKHSSPISRGTSSTAPPPSPPLQPPHQVTPETYENARQRIFGSTTSSEPTPATGTFPPSPSPILETLPDPFEREEYRRDSFPWSGHVFLPNHHNLSCHDDPQRVPYAVGTMLPRHAHLRNPLHYPYAPGMRANSFSQASHPPYPSSYGYVQPGMEPLALPHDAESFVIPHGALHGGPVGPIQPMGCYSGSAISSATWGYGQPHGGIPPITRIEGERSHFVDSNYRRPLTQPHVSGSYAYGQHASLVEMNSMSFSHPASGSVNSSSASYVYASGLPPVYPPESSFTSGMPVPGQPGEGGGASYSHRNLNDFSLPER